ncbi:hypothetical protein ACFL59_15650 [Planctomycetota bacterium]
MCEVRPRLVIVGGEVMTPSMRHHIGLAFNAPVRQHYSSMELFLIAWECPTTGELHTCDDSVVVEVIGDDGHPARPGERGEVVGTSLLGYAMPFIRYRLGDLVTRGGETCTCGWPSCTITSVHGRMLDYFPLPDGRVIHPWEITCRMIYDNDWIRQYRLVQERPDRFLLKAVACRAPTPGERTTLCHRAQGVLGDGVSFRIELVPELRFEPSGKFRLSRSLVQSEYDGMSWSGSSSSRPSPDLRDDRGDTGTPTNH